MYVVGDRIIHETGRYRDLSLARICELQYQVQSRTVCCRHILGAGLKIINKL